MLFLQKYSQKTKKYYLCGGEMAERSNAAVLKTVDLLPRIRGFESLFLRQRHQISRTARCATFCFMNTASQACLSKQYEIKQKSRKAGMI
jgi:hypothetical protein